jgi:hypothetical protein
MKCVTNDGNEAINMNNIDRYCYEHYQIYDSLLRLYQEVSKSVGSITWTEFLTRVLDPNFKASWKTSLIDANNGETLSVVASVVKAELENKGN